MKEKEELVKALADAGHRESALLLKNWGEMDEVAKLLKKNMDFDKDGKLDEHERHHKKIEEYYKKKKKECK